VAEQVPGAVFVVMLAGQVNLRRRLVSHRQSDVLRGAVGPVIRLDMDSVTSRRKHGAGSGRLTVTKLVMTLTVFGTYPTRRRHSYR
jgi:hypothetical protein